MRYPEALQKIIALFRKLPGVGKKTAERYAFQMIFWKEHDLSHFAHLIHTLKNHLLTCSECGALYEGEKCPFCDSTRRDTSLLCVVASPKDLFSIESTGIYNGLYHVMQGLLSPLHDRGLSAINFDDLKKRVVKLSTREVILAFDSTVEGDATALYLKRELEKLEVRVSRLAMGMPLGSSLDFLDEGTLSRALSSRLPL